MGKRGPQPSGTVPISIRLRPELRAALDKIAETSARPLSDVVNSQLNRSLSEDDAIERRFGSRENYNAMHMIALAISRGEALAGKSWLEDGKAFDLTLEAIRQTLLSIRPPSHYFQLREQEEQLYRDAKDIASSNWKSVLQSEANGQFDRLKRIYGDMRDIVDRSVPSAYREEFRPVVEEYYRRASLAAAKLDAESSEEHRGDLDLYENAFDKVAEEMILEGHFDPRKMVGFNG